MRVMHAIQGSVPANNTIVLKQISLECMCTRFVVGVYTLCNQMQIIVIGDLYPNVCITIKNPPLMDHTLCLDPITIAKGYYYLIPYSAAYVWLNIRFYCTCVHDIVLLRTITYIFSTYPWS